MITVFDETIRQHDPPAYAVAGRLQPSPERSERVDLLLAGLRSLNSPIVSPPPLQEGVLETLHCPRYLYFLASAHERWSRIRDAAPFPVPNVHALGRSSLPQPHYPDSIVGQCGYHLADGSAPILANTFDAAVVAAASAVHGSLLTREGQHLVYVLARPPGHHASRDAAAGFCYLNNAALAAEDLTRAGIRTAILDIDVHHGNGTEAIFYDRADVLTASIHADPSRFYPFFWGYVEETGRGVGTGFNLNLPLPRQTGDREYESALTIALRAIATFRADVVVVSAGLDIAADDPFHGFAISTRGFERIGRAIRELSLPTLIIQEGGYPAANLSNNLAALLSGLGA
jgi:acetoin utilization deacetylase AcuC-like enzyme